MAQACHAATAAIHLFYGDESVQQYLADLDNMHKVVLEVPGEKELRAVAEKLSEAGIQVFSTTIRNNGITVDPRCPFIICHSSAQVVGGTTRKFSHVSGDQTLSERGSAEILQKVQTLQGSRV